MSFDYPEDAEAHYQELLNKTAKFRGHPTHYTTGFDGPWIENLWIENFISKPLSYFRGLIPIFVQFVDIHVHSFMRMGSINNRAYLALHQELYETLKTLLRPNVLYIAISQDDEGITFGELFKTRPNILTLSAGGMGHIPIPLVKGIMPHIPLDFIRHPEQITHKAGFYGAPQNGDHRKILLKHIEQEFRQLGVAFTLHFGRGWEAKMAATLINLAPRGFGRTSYRLAEVIQTGRIPLFLYSGEVAWVPYRGTNISVEAIGFIATSNETNPNAPESESIPVIARKIAALNQEGAQALLRKVDSVREHYTLPGVIAQIDKFVQDPLAPNGGQLRCVRVPTTTV